MNPNQQHQNRDKNPPQQPPERPEQKAPEPAAWVPDENTFILVPENPFYIEQAKLALRERFPGHKGAIEHLIHQSWLHQRSSILVMPLRDIGSEEISRKFTTMGNERDRLDNPFGGFLECEPVIIAAHDEQARHPSQRLWRPGRHSADGTLKIKGEGGLVDLLNLALSEGKQRLPDGKLIRGVPLGRVTLRMDRNRDGQISQTTLQLSYT